MPVRRIVPRMLGWNERILLSSGDLDGPGQLVVGLHKQRDGWVDSFRGPGHARFPAPVLSSGAGAVSGGAVGGRPGLKVGRDVPHRAAEFLPLEQTETARSGHRALPSEGRRNRTK